jgi:hypothetical protein
VLVVGFYQSSPEGRASIGFPIVLLSLTDKLIKAHDKRQRSHGVEPPAETVSLGDTSSLVIREP